MATVLSNETKRIIDDAKDTLVGQIPVPMMQCQQITLALTYKFMSDDDQQAVDLGGRRHYFTGDLEKYEWSKVVSLRLELTPNRHHSVAPPLQALPSRVNSWGD